MKRIIVLLLCTVLAASTAACSTTPANSTPANASSASISSTVVSSALASSSASSAKGIEVDDGLLSDTITYPASMVKGVDINTLKSDAAKDGIKDVTQNKDGSVTYKMTKATHQKMIDDTRQTTVNAFNKLKDSSDFPYVKDITYNGDFTVVTLAINKSAYDDTYKEILAFNVGMQTYFYQIINGIQEESIKTTIKFQNQKTKDVFDTATYPEPTK